MDQVLERDVGRGAGGQARPAPTHRPGAAVPGLERGIAILRLFTRDRPRIAPPRMSVELGIPRSTVHRLVMALVELDLLRPEPGGAYALGPGVLRLGFEYLATLDIVQLANPILARLRDELGWATNLGRLQGTHIVFLSRHPSRAAFFTNIGVGTSLPAHASSMGRLLLGAMDVATMRALYRGRTLEGLGSGTPTTFKALEALIAADRERGYAVGGDFYDRGVVSVAAPLRDSTGHVIAAISASTIGAVAPSDIHGRIQAKVRAAAADISMLLGAPQSSGTASTTPPKPRRGRSTGGKIR